MGGYLINYQSIRNEESSRVRGLWLNPGCGFLFTALLFGKPGIWATGRIPSNTRDPGYEVS